MQRLFILAWSALVIVVIGLMVMLYVSLIPHFFLIGDIAFVVLCVFLLYGVILGGYGTYHLIATWSINRRVIVRGEVVAYLDRTNNTFTHLSAQHEAAKVLPQPQVTVKELPSPDPRWDAVLDLRKDGKGMHAIAKELKVPYNRVRTFLNQVEGNDNET